MENKKKQNNKSNNNTAMLILGIIFICLQGFQILGTIFLIVYLLSSIKKVQNVKEEGKPEETEEKDIDYTVEDADVEEKIEYNNMELADISFEDTNVSDKKETTFEGGATDKKWFDNNNGGPIKYY